MGSLALVGCRVHIDQWHTHKRSSIKYVMLRVVVSAIRIIICSMMIWGVVVGAENKDGMKFNSYSKF